MKGGNCMGNNKQTNLSKKNVKNIKNNAYGKLISIALSTVIIVGLGFFLLGGGKIKDNKGNSSVVKAAVKIDKKDVTSTVKFYPYESNGINMEVFAVKASDETIRTALNTCQICYSSGRGYYIQEGDELVCQNCGNRFNIDQVEKIKNGCNPVPVLEENKTDDGSNIIIDGKFLDEKRVLFKNWKS